MLFSVPYLYCVPQLLGRFSPFPSVSFCLIASFSKSFLVSWSHSSSHLLHLSVGVSISVRLFLPSPPPPFVFTVEGCSNLPGLLQLLKLSSLAGTAPSPCTQLLPEPRPSRSCCSNWTQGCKRNPWDPELQTSLQWPPSRLGLPKCALCPRKPSKGSPKGAKDRKEPCSISESRMRPKCQCFLGRHDPIHTGTLPSTLKPPLGIQRGQEMCQL